MPPFHLAFPVRDIASTRHFYASILGCQEGRSAARWIDFNFFGHQISAHLQDDSIEIISTNEVDGDSIPIRHFGVILDVVEWKALTQKLKALQYPFLIAPKIRFEGLPGEQGTCFLKDPSGNVLEFKCFGHPSQIFEREQSV